jgi:hypothetical protein
LLSSKLDATRFIFKKFVEIWYRSDALYSEFHDFNGRTARLLMNLVLLRNGYPFAMIKSNNRKEYLESLGLGDEENLS